MGCMLHGAPPTTPALSQAPSRCDTSLALLPLTLEASGSTTAIRTAEEMADPGQKTRSRRMAGSESWQGGNIEMEETACTLWEIRGVWARAPSLLHPPLEGLELLLISCQRRKGKEREEHLPHHPHRHTDTLTHPSSPKAPPPVGQHHIQGQTTTPQPHHNPPCLSSEQQGHPGTAGAPLPPTDILQPPGKREWGRRKGEGRVAVRAEGQPRGEGEKQGQPFAPQLLTGRPPANAPGAGGTWLLTCCLLRHHHLPPPSQNPPHCRTP